MPTIRATRSNIASTAGGVTLADVDYVAFYDKPFLKFERLLETYLTFSPRGFRSFRMALPLWLREKLFLKSLLASELKALEPKFDWDKRLAFSEHHLSHAASAFYPSPFQRAAVLTMDGVGEWATTSGGRRQWPRVQDPEGNQLSPTASACSMRRSRITPASRSIRGSTRSWGSPPMASRIRPAHLRQSDRPQARRLVFASTSTTSTTAPALR